mgnify:CR=1 FL=1
MTKYEGLGWLVLQKVLLQDCEDSAFHAQNVPPKVRVQTGKVGTLKTADIFGSIITAAKKGGIIDDTYREEHAAYVAVKEAMYGVGRGNSSFGDVLRTISLRFAVARGPLANNEKGDWIAVGLYGTIGSMMRGHEHEVAGMGITPI